MSTLSLAAQQKSVEGVPSDTSQPVVDQSPTVLEHVTSFVKSDAGDLHYLFDGEFDPIATPLATPPEVSISQPLMNEIHQAASLGTVNQSGAVTSNPGGPMQPASFTSVNPGGPMQPGAVAGWTFSDTLRDQGQKISSLYARMKARAMESTGGSYVNPGGPEQVN